MKESDLIKKISDYLKTVPNLFYWKEHGGMYGTAGIPDMIVCYRGRFIGFECKVGKNKPTVLQAVTIKQIINAGGYAMVVRSVDEVKQIIAAFEKEYKTERPSKCVIEGRTVNQRNSYELVFKPTTNKYDRAFYEDGYIWFPIQSVEENGVQEVYDIQVAEDNSFTANGAIAHNCQDISVAGKGAGIKEGTRSGLLLEVERLLNVSAENGTLPKFLLLENVKNLVSKKFKADFDRWLSFLSSLGYTNYWQILNAKDYGIPQNRERVFCVSIRGDHSPFKFPEKQELKLRLRDMIDTVVDEKYYLKESTIRSILSSSFNARRDSIRNPNGWACCLKARDFHEPQCVQVGEVVGEKWDRMHDISRCVYEPDGLSPTVHCQQGGNTELKIAENYAADVIEHTEEPVIAAMRGRNPENPSDRTTGIHTEQRLEVNEKGLCNTLTSVQKDNLVVENQYVARRYEEFIKEKGYVPEMFVAYNKQEVEDIAPTLTGQCSCASGSSAILKIELPIVDSVTSENNELKILAPNNWGHKAGDGTATRERRETDIVPALQANAGQTQQSYLKIKSATKLGYDEATEGDYINITYPIMLKILMNRL